MTIAEGTVVPLRGIRKTAARRMVTAWAAPVFHLTVEVDMQQASSIKQRVPGATVTDVIVAAAAGALLEVEGVNVHVGDDEVTTFPTASVGIAVATPKGLMVPVIRNADQLTIAQIAEHRRDLVGRARDGGLTIDDMTGGTFTISNLGMMGVARFDAILNVPQAAILAVGSTVERQVKLGDEIRWASIAEFTLTCDHRAIDGALGATFLAALARRVETPGS